MSFSFFCISNLKGLSHIVHFLHSYTASSKVTGSLQCRGQMPIHNNISACWHRPKVIFFFFFFSTEGRVCIRRGRGEQQAAGRARGSARCEERWLRTTPSPPAPGCRGESTLCCFAPSCQKAQARPRRLPALPKHAPQDLPGPPASRIPPRPASVLFSGLYGHPLQFYGWQGGNYSRLHPQFCKPASSQAKRLKKHGRKLSLFFNSGEGASPLRHAAWV